MGPRVRRILTFVIAGLTLVGQVILATGALTDAAAARDAARSVDAIAVFCAGPHTPGHSRAVPHRLADPAICPAGFALAAPLLAASPAPVLPLPTRAVLAATVLQRPPGRGPPAPGARVSPPRAPPPLPV